MRLHFSIGGDDYLPSKYPYLNHSSPFFAYHMHRRSGVYNKFLFLTFELMQGGTYFRTLEECCSVSCNIMFFLTSFSTFVGISLFPS